MLEELLNCISFACWGRGGYFFFDIFFCHFDSKDASYFFIGICYSVDGCFSSLADCSLSCSAFEIYFFDICDKNLCRSVDSNAYPEGEYETNDQDDEFHKNINYKVSASFHLDSFLNFLVRRSDLFCGLCVSGVLYWCV